MAENRVTIRAFGGASCGYTYLKVCSCFSLSTVRTRVGLPSDGPEGPLPRILLCEPDSLPESETGEQS